MFIAAICLGFAYNATSPLGVRLTASAPAVDSASDQVTYSSSTVAVLVPQAVSAVTDPALHNETIHAVIVGTASGSDAPEAVEGLVTALAWPEVKPLLARGDVVLVDGRDSLSYEAGHIPGAVSLPLSLINEKIADFSAKYPKTKPVVVYCASIQCPIAHAESLLLRDQLGYTDVREMPGGYAEWLVAESKATASTGERP